MTTTLPPFQLIIGDKSRINFKSAGLAQKEGLQNTIPLALLQDGPILALSVTSSRQLCQFIYNGPIVKSVCIVLYLCRGLYNLGLRYVKILIAFMQTMCYLSFPSQLTSKL